MSRIPNQLSYLTAVVSALSLWILFSAFSPAASLPLPSIPSSLTYPADRADYLMTHFWDHMIWTDSTAIASDTLALEQSLSTYYSIVPHARPQVVETAIASLLDSAASAKSSLNLVAEISTRYLDEPQSPVYNPECYETFCELFLTHLNPDDPIAALYNYNLERLRRNHPGSKAADFTFVDRYGNTSTLHSVIDTTATEIRLLFFDPDCIECHHVIASMMQQAEKLSSANVQTILITPIETDTLLFLDYALTLPQQWIVGYSPEGEIDSRPIYDIPTIPTLYILSPDGIVKERNSTRFQP